MNTPDVIIVGLGAMGTAAAWQLGRRGVRVLGLEQFALGHELGSSHGQTRIIRQAYYEHPDYVPLVQRAFAEWYELECASGEHLLTTCPCLSIGPPDSDVVQGVRRSSQEHCLPIEDLTASEVQARYPAFDLSTAGDVVGVLEHTAGFLYVDRCVRAMANEAVKLGAELRTNEPVISWERRGTSLVVRTAAGEYHAPRLVLTAGPWAGRLLGAHGAALRVMRQVVLWHDSPHPELFRRDRFPIFLAQCGEAYYYGLPAIDRHGVKVARHYGAPELSGPEGIQREVTEADHAGVRDFLQRYLPAAGAATRSSTCLYTLTPDRHFLIDRHPEQEGVVFAAGFSGHGFKFAPAIGEILADLVATGCTSHSIGLFRPGRFGSTGHPGG